MPEPLTPVLFRIGRSKAEAAYGATAIFPTIGEGPGRCCCYAHVGQHSSCALAWVRDRKLRFAKPEEYAALKRELEAPPYHYNLKVIKRLPNRSKFNA